MARLRLRRRDAPLVALLLVALGGVGGSIWSGAPATTTPTAASPSARPIDRARLEGRLGDGTLQRREAEWWRPAGDGR